jgi:lysylphosphatidylglycerol synthetase-like protein (DUF2156 family)
MPASEITSRASEKLKFRVVFSSLVVVGALLITWLTVGDSSPLHEYFLSHSAFQDLWQMTVFAPYLASVMLSGNAHSPPMAIFILALILQWFVLGFFLSIPMTKLWLSRKRK